MLYPKEDLDHIVNHTKDIFQELRGKSIFLTGSSGWIGSWIFETLKYADLDVTCLSRYSDEFPSRRFDIIIHAGFSSLPEIQVLGTQKLLRFSKDCGAQKFLILGSGIKQVPIMDCVSDSEKLNYKITKEIEETLALCEWPFEVKMARIYTLTGPGLPLKAPYALSKFVNDALNGLVHVNGFGNSVRSYLYMSDLMIWLFTILIQGKNKVPYLVGSDRPITIYNVAELVAKTFGTYVVRHVDASIPFSHYLPDLTQTKELGLEITVPLEQSLLRTCHWFMKKQDTEGMGKNGIVRSTARGPL